MKRTARQGNRMPTQRQLRVGEEIRHILSDVLARGYLPEADLSLSVTVSEARVSPDLRHAKVFVMPMAGKALGEVVEILNDRASVLRGALGKRLVSKYIPRLVFVADTSYLEAHRIETLLKSDRVAQDLGPYSEEV